MARGLAAGAHPAAYRGDRLFRRLGCRALAAWLVSTESALDDPKRGPRDRPRGPRARPDHRHSPLCRSPAGRQPAVSDPAVPIAVAPHSRDTRRLADWLRA